MLSQLNAANRLVGAKQVRRALSDGRVRTVFVADDADARVTRPVEELAGEKGVPVTRVPSMKELGEACNIAVGAAVAAILK